MAIKLISDYIPEQLAKHLGPHVDEGTLIKVTPGTRGATVSGGTAPTETSHACSLWVSSYEDGQIDGSSIRSSDRKISILGATIDGGAVPAPNDKVIAEGVTYRIVGDAEGGRGVARDPVGAVYRCHCRA
jgi:hypothetical protein